MSIHVLFWEKSLLAGKVCMADLKLSPSYFVDVIRNDHFEQVTKKKCQSWNGREIVGCSLCGMDEKSWVDPPPSPTTPASYRPLFCNLRQFRPYGRTTSFRTHACCKTHVFTLCRTTMLNLSQITKQLSIRDGCGGGRWRIDPRFFVHSKIDLSLK